MDDDDEGFDDDDDDEYMSMRIHIVICGITMISITSTDIFYHSSTLKCAYITLLNSPKIHFSGHNAS